MKTIKILVIDDERGIKDLLKFILQPKGFQVFTADNGKEGLEMFKKDSYDCVFLDLHMPVMNGLEALQLIKQIRPDQSVMLLSSSSDPQFHLEEEAKRFGVGTCFYKPFYIDEMINILEDSLKEKGITTYGNQA